MNLGEYLERWGRAIFENPFAATLDAQEPPELAEIRLAILDEIRKKSYRSGGRRVFPFNFIRINLRGVDESRTGVFKGMFFRKYFEQEIRASLNKAECRFPEDLRVDVTVTRTLPKPDEEWMWIEIETRDSPTGAGRRPARLVVLEGQANAGEIVLQKERTNIGRTVDVYRSDGLSRRNDLAFTEDSEVNRSVSREHAHILFDKPTGEYRLFNDRWYQRDDKGGCGIWIVRDGLSLEVHRTPRGAKLEPGDEIHLGRAVLRFQAR
jgi:hypothetical protein